MLPGRRKGITTGGRVAKTEIDELEVQIRAIPGVLGCVVLTGVDGGPTEIQAFTQVGTDRDSVQSTILQIIADRDLPSPVSQVYVFELEAESYFGDIESMERAVELAEQEAMTRGLISRQEGVKEATGAPAGPIAIPSGPVTARPVLRRVALSASSWRSEAEVALSKGDAEIVGLATSEKTPYGLKVLAEATLGAVGKIVADVEFKLKSASLVNVSGHEAILVLVAETDEEGDSVTVGAALRRDAPLTETAVRATLDAVNRRLTRAI
jgi:hypothetical protein